MCTIFGNTLSKTRVVKAVGVNVIIKKEHANKKPFHIIGGERGYIDLLKNDYKKACDQDSSFEVPVSSGDDDSYDYDDYDCSTRVKGKKKVSCYNYKTVRFKLNNL